MEKSKSTRFYVGLPVTNAVLVRLSKPIQVDGATFIYEFRQRTFAHEVAFFDTKEDAEFAVKNQTKEDEDVLVIGYYEQIIPDNIGDLVPRVAVLWYRIFTLSDFS